MGFERPLETETDVGDSVNHPADAFPLHTSQERISFISVLPASLSLPFLQAHTGHWSLLDGKIFPSCGLHPYSLCLKGSSSQHTHTHTHTPVLTSLTNSCFFQISKISSPSLACSSRLDYPHPMHS